MIDTLNLGQMNKRSFVDQKKSIRQKEGKIKLTDYLFYRPYRGEKPVFVNNHAEAVMRGIG
jgi:hypothetical protein